MIQRSDRPFLGIWRGDREFTEWRRGERVLWQKAVPEVPQEKLRSLTVTAASYADLALLDFVLWAIGQGHTGHVTATIGGEVHSLGGVAPLLSVRSVVSANDGRTATLSIGEESALNVESLRVGDALSLSLVVEAGEVWLPKKLSSNTYTADRLPCLLPAARWAQLVGVAYRKVRPLGNNTLKNTLYIQLNGVSVGSVLCYISINCLYESVWSFGVPESALNKVLAETNKRPMVLVAKNTPTSYFEKAGTGVKLVWGRIDTVLTLIVTENADENML